MQAAWSVFVWIAKRSGCSSGAADGHAGAIISGEDGKAENKKAALRAAGAYVSDSPADIGVTMKRALGERGLG